ncbi:CapA family protein [Gracilibacillus marinus]|jgi:poly-gamma-glutamate capsule biosynthesis protein CapA/YwtB (metallophosphatase superfamily)|uniref:CapA family protein n=1 Tax=Gracilibacillus marinus TaxID=630535 RepID=A0ABV8VUG3_9BACI
MNKRIGLLLLFLIVLAGCQSYEKQTETTTAITLKQTEGNFVESIKPDIKEITIAAIGDILIHDRVYNTAVEGEGYNFLPMLTEVDDYLKTPTITMANQETIIGGKDIGLSSYPSFNSPEELADNFQEVGVDIVTMANNHTLDRGEIAIQNAIAHYEKIDMPYTGSYKSPADREKVRVIETAEGIKVGFLSYTYGTNGIPVPSGKDYLVNLIDKEQIEEDVKVARESADVIILSYHFGNEYERLPNDNQQELAQFASDLGVEVVIGHHPHVVQPVEWLEGKNGQKTLVAYSLGNFLSGQEQLYQRIGGMLQFQVSKISYSDDTIIEVSNPSFLPTFVQYDVIKGKMANFQVLPFHQVTEEQLDNHQAHYEEIQQHVQQWMPELQIIE